MPEPRSMAVLLLVAIWMSACALACCDSVPTSRAPMMLSGPLGAPDVRASSDRSLGQSGTNFGARMVPAESAGQGLVSPRHETKRAADGGSRAAETSGDFYRERLNTARAAEPSTARRESVVLRQSAALLVGRDPSEAGGRPVLREAGRSGRAACGPKSCAARRDIRAPLQSGTAAYEMLPLQRGAEDGENTPAARGGNRAPTPFDCEVSGTPRRTARKSAEALQLTSASKEIDDAHKEDRGPAGCVHAPRSPSEIQRAEARRVRAHVRGLRQDTTLCRKRSSSRASAAAPRVSLVEELLRVWVAEAGWHSPRSHAALAHVLKRYALRNGVSIAAAADVLVWKHSNAQLDRPWLRYLSPRCSAPDGYPFKWSEAQPLCIALVKRAHAFLAGRVGDPCKGRADGWRTPKSRALRKALKNGYARVRCAGGTSLAFVRGRG